LLEVDQGLVFRLDRGLKPGYYSGGEGGSTCKGKISAQINSWHVADFSFHIFLEQSIILLSVCKNLSGKNNETTHGTITRPA